MPYLNDSNERLLNILAVSEKVSLSRNSIYLLIRQGAFPRQVKVTSYASRWLETEINTWIQERVKERGGCNE